MATRPNSRQAPIVARSRDRRPRSYPRCVSGEGRCPPEDCGGPQGDVEFLLACADPNHEQHASMVHRPGAFNPATVKFDDPKNSVWRQEVDAKQRTRVTMALKIALFPSVKTFDDFDFTFQPSIDPSGAGVGGGPSWKPDTRCSSPPPLRC
jgi:hypothetical protein